MKPVLAPIDSTEEEGVERVERGDDAVGSVSFKERVSAVQMLMKVPKSQTNSFGTKFKYRSLEDIIEQAKPLCPQYRLLFTLSDSILAVGDHAFVVAQARIDDLDSDNYIVVYASARVATVQKGMQDGQLSGSTSSYARKYACNGIFLLDDSKLEAAPDLDSMDNRDCGDSPKNKSIGHQAAGKEPFVTKDFAFLRKMTAMKTKLREITGDDSYYKGVLAGTQHNKMKGDYCYASSKNIPDARHNKWLTKMGEALWEVEEFNKKQSSDAKGGDV